MRSGLSVRVRITASVAVLVFLALATAGLIIYIVSAARLESDTHAEADQEVAEFRRLQKDGRDPRNGEPFAGLEDLLRVFFSRNVPGEHEVLVGWLDGRLRFSSPVSAEPLARDDEFQDVVRSLETTGGDRVVTLDGSERLVAVQPIRDPQGNTGALVVVMDLDRVREGLNATMQTYAVVAVLSLFTITGLAAWHSGRLLAPLRELNDTAREISGTDLSRRIATTGNDDISALTRTINEMLDRLETTVISQRQFLDDAGHELKTPLTVLRGHLELLAYDDDIEETQELLLEEVDRMSRLVGDLILLAKTRRPDFLRPEPTDVAEVLHNTHSKARALGDRDWRLDSVPEQYAVLDGQRVTQALLQLADNAVKHTEEGAEIGVGGTADGRNLRLWVRDTGHGVPAQDREKIFERFGRSRVLAGDEGFGLGLSIVSAITHAHGGSVTVSDARSTAPVGARFEIVIPLHVTAHDTRHDTRTEEPTWPAS